MANENKPNSNQSQFFITLDSCEWLNRKHTIFGKVTGSTVFNVLRMGECEVGENDLPVEAIKIISCEVLWNPFDDIIPRVMVAKENGSGESKTGGKVSKPDRKGTKDKKLLSFGEDEQAEEEDSSLKIRSLHDSKLKDKRLSSKVPEELQTLQSKSDRAERIPPTKTV